MSRQLSTSPREAAAKQSESGGLLERFREVRTFTTRLCNGLEPEDMVVQSMPDVSPTKWHLAHTSWFFETFVLAEHQPGYRPFDPAFAYLFNSYYVQAGERHCRDQRGYISRPTVSEVLKYRQYVDEQMDKFLRTERAAGPETRALIGLGLHHEQQHQELMLTDIKHVFSVNPLRPAYRVQADEGEKPVPAQQWLTFEGGLQEIGWDSSEFAFDNESPLHRVYIAPFELSS